MMITIQSLEANPDLRDLDPAAAVAQLKAAAAARALGYAVGLDGFSPPLTPLVGQALGVLRSRADWMKIMSYGHTLGSAVVE